MIKVVCAIIENDDKFLIAQRSDKMSLPLKWEFPGGKIEKDEDKKTALKREIQEELSIEIEIGNELDPIIHHYENFSITLIPFLCSSNSREFKRKEHKEIRWEKKENLKKYDWAAADIPIINEILCL